jgi:tetratricopeptide (TPR) repeat protein
VKIGLMKARQHALLWLPVLAILVSGQATAQTITFNKDVAPILFQHCASCHHPSGIGPFPLLTFEDARKHKTEIVAVTSRRYMPPWPPEAGYGDFLDDRRLTDDQIRTLAAWAKTGAAEGDPSQKPKSPLFTTEWQMGPPDLILKMEQPFTMPSGGTDVFRNFIIKTGLSETRFVRGLELRLNNTRVVHHANIVLDRTEALRARDGKDGSPGFPGMDVTTEASPNTFDPDSHFLFWKPGTVLRPSPPSMSWRLDPGTDLVVNLHLEPTGKPENIQAEVGLYFAKTPPSRYPILVQLEHDGAIDIPPGSTSFTVTDHVKIPVDSELLAIYPHAHYLGKVIEAWAILPNGEKQWLIRIPDWDINWQAVYEYRRPMLLPKGTDVHMRVLFDNSVSNPRNPQQPPVRVRFGDRTKDEMGHVWLQLLPSVPPSAGKDDRVEIQEAVMRRRLAKYPADFLAEYNLGSLLQMQGKPNDAIACYQDALKAEPGSVTARNSLGAALLANGQVADAIVQLKEAVRLDGAYLNARYNLARAQLMEGDLDGAAHSYESFLQRRSDDAEAQAGLATVYVKQHRFNDALPHFREAVRLNPSDADQQTNLGTVLAIVGDLPAAIEAYEHALAIDPHHPTANANLQRAKADLAAGRR